MNVTTKPIRKIIKMLRKLKLKFAQESPARARRRVQKALKTSSDRMRCVNMFTQGEEGYYRDERIYRGGEK